MSCELWGKKKLNGEWRVGICSNFKVLLVYIPHKLVCLKWSPTQLLNKNLHGVVGMLPSSSSSSSSSSCLIPTTECYVLLLQPTTKVYFMHKSLFYYTIHIQSKTINNLRLFFLSLLILLPFLSLSTSPKSETDMLILIDFIYNLNLISFLLKLYLTLFLDLSF